MNIEQADITFDIMLHIGTLIPVIIVFWKDIIALIIEFFMLLTDLIKKIFGINKKINLNSNRIFIIMIIVASIPTAIIGYIFNDWAEYFFNTLDIVGFALIITGILMLLSDKLKKGKKEIGDIKFSNSIIVGVFQGLAIIPGISRSGSTIFAALLNGFTPQAATKFSFILSIPVILGAAILKGRDAIILGTHSINYIPIIIGMLFAAISGFLAIKVLIRLLNKGKLHYFSYYCWILGLFILMYNFFIY